MPPVITSPWEFAGARNSDGTWLSVQVTFDATSRVVQSIIIVNGSDRPATLILADRTDGAFDVYTVPAGELTLRPNPHLAKRSIRTVDDLMASPFDVATG